MNNKTVGDYTLLGYSLAGEETVVGLPELNVCFDVGRAPREIIPIDNLCISHGHMDHAAGVAYYLSQRGFIGASPGRVIIHRDQARNIQRLMEVWSDIEGHHAPGDIEGVLDGDEIKIRRDMFIRAFDVNHSAKALGFSIIERRHKLKPELIGKTGPQLVALKKQGIAIEDFVQVPLVTYCGDTAIGDFLNLEYVTNAGILIIECTFFEQDHLRRARVGRHIHVSDLRHILERVRSQHVVLTHVTRRTDLRQAKRIARDAVSPTDADRISFLMERPPRRDNRDRRPPVRTDARRP
jgi:ribonuclease Z